MTKNIEVGDEVWFTTKYGDIATGVVQADDTIKGHPERYMSEARLVKSYDAFGKKSEHYVMCLVSKNGIHPIDTNPQTQKWHS